ncbi:histidinol-phosphatase HisJ family protein [Thermincola ferriacetica]
MNVLADLHTHTNFSADGKDHMADMCRAAISKGLSYICFTDHIDNNPSDNGYKYFNYAKYSETIERMREEFGDKIQVLKGIEFAEPHLYPREFEDVLKKDFDIVMVGIHYLGETYVGDKVISGNYSKQQIFREYYREVLKAVKFGGFDVLAHFDLPKRYFKGSYSEKEMTLEILQEMVNKGIALEINTSPLRRGFTECTPDSEILKQYIEAGGTKVTTGSDAHSCGDIAADFDYAHKLIKDFQGIPGIFKGRRFIPIDSL